MNKRLLIVSLVVIICAVMAVIGTSAFFTKTGEVKTVIKTGNVDIAVHDKTAAGESSEATVYDIMPGDTVEKIVTVENTGTHPVYVRVKVTPRISNEKLDPSCLEIAFNTTDWTYDESDGYHYYNNVLEAGETTAPIYDSVYVNGPKVDNDYRAEYFSIDVVAGGVQSENNGQTVWDAAGWPED